LNRRRADAKVAVMEREGFVTTRLFVAASFIVLCMLAVAVLGAAA
jgi:hypothetical protein